MPIKEYLTNMFSENLNNLLFGIAASILATVITLSTRIIFYKIRDIFPSHSLFKGIIDHKNPCLVFILRMKDMEEKGIFKTPLPNYESAVTFHEKYSKPIFEGRFNTPWVSSTYDSHAMAHILNVLGRIGRTENIEVTFPDKDFDKWNSSMFILGGTWKAQRALQILNPLYKYENGAFILLPTSKEIRPRSLDEDIGLLEKMINPTNKLPIWLCWGFRGAATTAAAYALVRWWRAIGKLYGNKPFGLLVSFDDKDGWQQSKIISIYPKPNWFRKILFFYSWKMLKPQENKLEEESREQRTKIL